ncbi:uncharacterized protein LOC133801231 isoform X2 [Humulus lupulus]|uniref:uncharacterized protein LOC133801231 isoform X2 n=1 Tax=Humulus lupulus TaxID=3486 RepID=UPI002B410331|nr:uncharacterized protein LOC133801231 isoform X2 [Humulus lupulus]
MSGKGGSNGKGSTGISSIPPASRKIVQSLKEIVNNCTEQEIYAMLKDCNMDPNEAVNRLLAQDPFHEVKSKREKKKENKDTTDLRPRGTSSSSNRGGKGGGDRYSGRGGSSQFSSNDSGAYHGKSAYKKENGSHGYLGSSSSAPGLTGNNTSRRPPSYSDSVSSENKTWTVGSMDGVSSTPQPPSAFQSAWLGVPGQVSMADIVKMGRPQAKVSASSNPPIHGVQHQTVPAPPSAHHNLHLSHDHGSKDSEFHNERGLIQSEDIGSNDEWPSIEQPQAASLSSVLEVPENSESYADSSNLPVDGASQHLKSQLDEVQVDEDDLDETLNAPLIGHASVSGRNIQEDETGGEAVFENDSYEDMSSYQGHGHTYEHNKAEDSVSSMAANLEQLSLQKDDRGEQPEEDVPSVVIPNHLQLHTPDCLNLSFGSFGSGTNAAISGSGSFAPRSMKSNLEETSASVDVPAMDTRNTEFYGDEHLGTTSDGNMIHRTGASAGEYESSSVPQAEAMKQETSEADQGNQYAFPSSAPGFTYENSQQLNVAFSHPQTSAQMQNLAPFSNVMQAYTNQLPSTLLASSVQTAREDLAYSPFPVTQSMPTKYNNGASSISGPTMSMPEALRAASMSAPQPTQQNVPGGNVATGPALPQHLAVHPYSQPTLPLGHFANMIGYPFLPQSYTYMPSAFQQTFAGNNTYHQSLAAVLPQYKNSVSVSSLPQSAAIASAYGFGSSTSIPGGNFPVNPPTAPTGTTIGYEDVLSSQYKEASHLMSLQQHQNDNSAMWVHGPGSRAMSAVPASTYYGFQGQNQQHAGFRQGQQQPSQQFGALSYPNFYHSQSGMSLEHQQQQNPRDASSLGGSHSQGQVQQPSKQSQQQLWQNSY